MTATLQTATLRQGEPDANYYRAGTGEPVLYLHHLVGMQGFEPAVEKLSRQFDVIAPYHPGWGPAKGLEQIDTGLDLVLHYADLLDKLGLDRVNIVGHSVGAWIGCEIASVLPHRVSKLVLVNPVGVWDDEIQGEDVFAQPPMAATQVLYATPESREAATSLSSNGSGNSAVDPSEGIIQEMLNLKAAAKYLWPVPDTGIERRLGRIDAPTLIVMSEQDRFVPPAYGPLWQARIAGSQLQTLQGVGHLANVERPDEFAAAVAAFLG
jgi:pimeloyl-ACP methyl ester carboxylesterase